MISAICYSEKGIISEIELQVFCLMFISPAFFLDDSENKETHSVLGKVC
jgi:hypothetical protein